MPVVFRFNGIRFHFFSNEGNPREPVHIHVTRDGMDAKFWLHPVVTLAYNDGYDARTLKVLQGLVRANRCKIEDAWNDHFGFA